jgi:predicted transcriptional regulator
MEVARAPVGWKLEIRGGSSMKVEQVMKQAVQACRRGDALNTAAQIMWEHDCGCVPVVDTENRVIGMITDRDICMAAYTRGEPLQTLRVETAIVERWCSPCRPSSRGGPGR